MTPQLISMQGFAFRGRPLSLLVAYAPAGLTCSAFPAGVFTLPSNQLLEETKTDETYIHYNKKTSH
ncbi:hypothetical protein AAAC51_31295 [Priestia megaterium]